MKADQIVQMVIAGVVVSLIMEWLKTRRATVSTSAVWFNPETREYEPL